MPDPANLSTAVTTGNKRQHAWQRLGYVPYPVSRSAVNSFGLKTKKDQRNATVTFYWVQCTDE